MIPETMKAVVTVEAGSPNVLQLKEVAVPKVKPGWTLVKVRAAGLNRSEMYTRQGHSPNVEFPRVQGIECVGEVAASENPDLPVGCKVAANMGEMGREFDGSYAEYTLLPDDIICPFESTLDWVVLGAIPELYATAHGSLTKALKVKKGETLLVRGGTSSVGLAAISLAKALGLEVTATSRPKSFEAKRGAIADAGATPWIDESNLSEKDVQFDKVLELVGTTTLIDSLAMLKPNGICCFTGILGNAWSLEEFAPFSHMNSCTYLTTYASGPWEKDKLLEIISLIEKGDLKPPIYKTVTLEELVEAHQIMEESKAIGKMVLVIK